jgi:hypothetical protein
MKYLPEFKYAVGLKDQGDNKIKLVASALDDYGKVRDNPAAKGANIVALRNLSKACAWWLFDKQKKIAEKTSDRTQSRAVEVRELLRDALKALTELSPEEGQYATRKCAAIGAGMVVVNKERATLGREVKNVSFSANPEGTKTLASGYELERKDYLKKGKQSNPVSASHVEYAMHNNPTAKEKFSSKEWETLSYADYGAIAKILGKGGKAPSAHEVGYFKRAERLVFLISYDNGVLTYAQGGKTPADLMVRSGDGRIKYGLMYAMDRYGNLYAEECARGQQRKKTDKFNHSSFCSGDSVICAGVLAVDTRGALVYIDTASGHYKPGLQDLIRALAVLSSAGIDLTNVRARDFAGDKDYVAASLATGARVEWTKAMNDKLGLAENIAG